MKQVVIKTFNNTKSCKMTTTSITLANNLKIKRNNIGSSQDHNERNFATYQPSIPSFLFSHLHASSFFMPTIFHVRLPFKKRTLLNQLHFHKYCFQPYKKKRKSNVTYVMTCWISFICLIFFIQFYTMRKTI